MHSQMLAYAMVVLSAACCADAYPVYPEIESMKDFAPTDFNLVDSTVGVLPDKLSSNGLRRPSQNWNSALSTLKEVIYPMQKAGQWNGGKEPLPDDATDNLVEGVKTILWKLAAADSLQNQGFVKADQTPQKPSKRACFWKYCVTN